MKTPKINLYSRLALITSVTLVMGYVFVYAWYAIPDVNTGDTLSKDLINHMLSNITELKTSVDGKISSQWNTSGSDINYTAGKVGIGTASPTTKLDVNGNINSTPILARWNIELPYQAANTNLNWNSELINTNPAYIQKNASGTGINILVAGYYQANVKVLQYNMCDGCRGDVYLRRNGVSIGSMIGYGGPGAQIYFYHSFSNLYYFNAGDVITIYAESYPVHPGSSLEIVKLN